MFYSNQKIFKILFEIIPEGVIIVNEKEIIVGANYSVEKMFGYKKGELSNEHVSILIPSEHQRYHSINFFKFLKNNSIRKIEQGLSVFGITKKNKKFPIEIGLKPFQINNKTYIIAILIDITKRKANEREIENINTDLEKKIEQRTSQLHNTITQLKELNLNYKKEIKRRIKAENSIKEALKKEIELNELKTKFLSLVSHEFKTPLSGILTSTILLSKYKSNNQQDKRDKHLKIITSKVHFLNNILNDFLSIERLDSSKVNYKLTIFNLSKVVNEVVYSANMLLKTGQNIIIPENIDSYNLYLDEKILELTLYNLIYNAIKYSSENTTINLKVHQNKTSIKFTVTDEGIGIPLNDQKYIFNRYFRAENVLNIQGTGIGLNIVKAHLENLGGSIYFTSKENEGSEFTVELPIIKQP